MCKHRTRGGFHITSVHTYQRRVPGLFSFITEQSSTTLFLHIRAGFQTSSVHSRVGIQAYSTRAVAHPSFYCLLLPGKLGLFALLPVALPASSALMSLLPGCTALLNCLFFGYSTLPVSTVWIYGLSLLRASTAWLRCKTLYCLAMLHGSTAWL